MIQGHGSQKPEIIFVTDSGVGTDLKTNYAITGYAQTMLQELCKDAQISWDNQYFTTLVKQEFKEHYGKVKGKGAEDELVKMRLDLSAQYFPVLENEIKELNPFIIVPLGELAFHQLTGLSGIRKFRGSVLPATGFTNVRKVLPILGPYPYLYSDPKMKVISRLDFTKLPAQFNTDPPADNLFNVWVAKSSAALRNFLDRSVPGAPFVTVDIESFKGIPSCMCFCFDGRESVSIPLLHKEIDHDNRVLMMRQCADILASNIPKVNQNIKFDWQILNRWGFIVKNIVGDTMIAASVIYCEFPKNLGFLTSIYTNLPYFKDEGKEWDPKKTTKDRLYLYNAKDGLATWQIHDKQQKEIDELGVRYVHDEMIKLIPIYRIMEDNGIRIDMERRERLLAKYESLFHTQVLKLKRFVGRDINPLSSKVCNTLIFEELGFKKTREVKGTDEEALEHLIMWGHAEHSPINGKEILTTILAARKIHKVIEILELDIHPDGRFRGSANLAGTETGRTSGGKTIDEFFKLDDKGKFLQKRLGHSLQTIGKHGFMIDGVTYGKDIRSMFVPSVGYHFVEIDLSQAEARVDAVLAGNFDILSVFDSPTGIHRLTGSWVYGCKPEDIKKNDLVDGVDRYHMAKTVRHAGERNMKPPRLVMMTQRPLKECERILKTFHDFQPEMQRVYHRDVRQAVQNTRVLIAPNGRRRDFFGRIDEKTYNEAISQLPQAIVTDQTKFSFPMTLQSNPTARLLYEAHDGAMLETKIGTEEPLIRDYQRNVERPIDFRTGSLPRDIQLIIPSESSMGDNWQDLREIKVNHG